MIDISYESNYTRAEPLEKWLRNNSEGNAQNLRDVELVRIYEGDLFMSRDYKQDLGESQIIKCRNQAKLKLNSLKGCEKDLMRIYIDNLSETFSNFFLNRLISQIGQPKNNKSLQSRLNTEFS